MQALANKKATPQRVAFFIGFYWVALFFATV
jgi:hypothetical protein